MKKKILNTNWCGENGEIYYGMAHITPMFVRTRMKKITSPLQSCMSTGAQVSPFCLFSQNPPMYIDANTCTQVKSRP